MALTGIQVEGFRAFSDTGRLNIGDLVSIVGRNDCGKSGILHALRYFFEPPKKGLSQNEIHVGNDTGKARITLWFHPQHLASRSVKLDAKNAVDLSSDRLLNATGELCVRLTIGTGAATQFELLVADVDDDDLFPLALKGHDELLTLLEERGLPAVKAGKQTNSQKRKQLRDAVTAAGVGQREEWVDAGDVEKPIRALLPSLLCFADNARYGIGETGVQNQFKAIVDKAIAGTSGASAVEQQIRATVQAEFDKVFARLARLTESVASMSADTEVNWKKAVDGIQLVWQDPFGVDIPFELRGAGVRRLFMVAYFQYEAAESLHDENGPRYVFCIEEPEVHLHPGAQRTLLEALRELGALGHTVVLTTHSPVFAGATGLSNIVLITRDSAASTALQSPLIDHVAVARELGVEASDRLVGKNRVILVEGPRDVEFYSYVLSQLHAAGDVHLDPSSVLFLQCGGVNNLEFVVTMKCMDDAGLEWAVLVDSDRLSIGGSEGKTIQALRASVPASCRHLAVLERSFLESYLDPASIKAITGVDCVVPQLGRLKDTAGNELGERSLKSIKKSILQIAKDMGYAGIKASAVLPNGGCEWTKVFNDIGSAFTPPAAAVAPAITKPAALPLS